MYRLLHSLIPRPNSLGMRLAVTELMAPENEWTMLPDFFDQMPQLLFFFAACFVQLLFKGGIFIPGNSTDINDGSIRHV